jgi:coenzyme F420 hydrogenase subunit beta
MESYGYDKLVESYVASKGIDPSKITRMAIKKGSFIAMSGETELLHVPLKEVDAFVRNSCRQCDDFTAEFSDISVGAIGAPTGRSTVIARTEKGLKLIKDAEKAGYLELRELKPEEKGYAKVVSMVQFKRQRKAGKPEEPKALEIST